MMPVTHIAGALALTGWCIGPEPLVLVAGVVGAVLPDIDELHSPLGWRIGQLLPNPLLGIGKQRTHSFLWSVLISGVSWFIGLPLELVAALWVGWASHVLLDACSGGVPLWWPWYQGPEHLVRLASWRIAGLADYLSLLGCVAALLMVAWQDHWLMAWAEMLKQAVVEGRR